LLVELCSTHAEDGEHTIKKFYDENQKERNHLGKLEYKGVDWIHKEAYQWLTFVTTIMNLRIQ